MVSLILFLALFSAVVGADDIRLDVREHSLRNGMKVLIVPRPGKPTFQAFIMFDAGSIREIPGATGIAHLLEHMMFKGTKEFGTWSYKDEEPLMKGMDSLADEWYSEKEKTRNNFGKADLTRMKVIEEKMKSLLSEQRKYIISNELNDIYSRNGSSGLNAFTGREVVSYIVALPSNRLELWAAMESDRIANPVFREFYSERDVVNEERRMGDNNPMGRLSQEFNNMMYASSPYRNPIVGYESDILTVRRKDAEAFFRTFYSPDNAVIVITGNIDPQKTIETIRKYFEPIPSAPRQDHRLTLEREQLGERRITVESDASPEMTVGYHAPAFGSREYYALKVLSRVLSGGPSSRLFKTLVYDRKIARSVYTYLDGNRYATAFVISGSPLAPHTTSELEEAIYATLDLVKKVPVDRKELEKALTSIETDYVISLRKDWTVAYLLSSAFIMTGDWRNFDEREKLRAVTPDEIMKAAEKCFVSRNRTVATIRKSSSTERAELTKAGYAAPGSAEKGEKEKAKQVKSIHHSPGSQKMDKLPVTALKIVVPEIGREIIRTKLPNGMTVFLYQDRTLPLVSMQFVVKGGALYEDAESQGIARLTAAMVRKGGTKDHKAEELDEELDQQGITIYSTAGVETSAAYLTVLSRNAEKGLTMFREVITGPAFQADRLELQRNQVREDERRKNDNPQQAAFREFSRVLFGNHPYCWNNDTGWSTISHVTREDVIKWYETHYTPDNAYLLVSGDFEPKAMTKMIEDSFGSWKAPPAVLKAPVPLATDDKGGIYFLEKDMNQSIIIMGHEGVNRYSKDRPALEVMNFILGGGSFGSRMMKKIRSDEGLVYDVNSRLDADYQKGGVFFAFAQTKSDSTGRVIEMMKREIEAMKSSGVTAEELKWAKDSLINHFVHLLDDTLASRLMSLEILGMPAEYYRTYAEKINAVTGDDLARVAGRDLHPERMIILVEGDRKRLGRQLEAFGSVKEIKPDKAVGN